MYAPAIRPLLEAVSIHVTQLSIIPCLLLDFDCSHAVTESILALELLYYLFAEQGQRLLLS